MVGKHIKSNSRGLEKIPNCTNIIKNNPPLLLFAGTKKIRETGFNF